MVWCLVKHRDNFPLCSLYLYVYQPSRVSYFRTGLTDKNTDQKDGV